MAWSDADAPRAAPRTHETGSRCLRRGRTLGSSLEPHAIPAHDPPHATMKPVIQLGVGIYSRSEAARLLRVTPSRLRRWVSGYTYHYEYGRRRRTGHQPPVVAPDLPQLDGFIALSFLELMELRVVKALIDEGVSLQHVRSASRIAADLFHTGHPFASKRVYTDGQRIFSTLSQDSVGSDLIELSKDRQFQVIFGRVLAPFLNEIDFDPQTSLAHTWWPKGRNVPIVLNPRIAFGAPTIQGTRIRTSAVVRLAGATPASDLARAYQITVPQLKAALDFERELAAA